MFIVTDYGKHEHRLFFMTEESEESFFAFPDTSKSKDSPSEPQPTHTEETIGMEKKESPCCGALARYVTELSHVYQFDLDLYQCGQCGRYWVRAWRMGTGGWEKITAEDAEKMRALGDDELQAFMKEWARYLN